MRVRKRPVVVEAFRVPPAGAECSDEMQQWLEAGGDIFESDGTGSILIHTLEGSMRADPGDWIIKGVKGEFYPCKHEILAATYDEVIELHGHEAQGAGEQTRPIPDYVEKFHAKLGPVVK